MPKYALLIDYEYCTGCHSCEIACRNELEIGIVAQAIQKDGFGTADAAWQAFEA